MDKIDYIKDSLDRLHDKLDDVTRDHGDRIGSLEKKNEHQRGMITGAGIIITAVSGFVSFMVSHIRG